MTFIEHACHQHATALWERRPDLKARCAELFVRSLRYCEASAVQPTSSATIVVLRAAAAAGADLYRKQSPTLSKWQTTLRSEPQLLNRRASEFRTRAVDELRVHQELFARFIRSHPVRVR